MSFECVLKNKKDAEAWHDAIDVQLNLTNVAIKHHHGYDREKHEKKSDSPDVRSVLNVALGGGVGIR